MTRMNLIRTVWATLLALLLGFATQAQQQVNNFRVLTNLYVGNAITGVTLNGYNIDAIATNSAAGKLDATNGTAVNLTGSLTNVTAYGATTLLPGNVTGRTNVVQVAPYQSATYAAGDFGPNSGETSFEFINGGNAQRLRQTGTLQRVKVSIAATTGVTGFYVKLWRKLASNNYSLVGTSENLNSQLSAGIVDTLDLSTPIAAQLGDYVGVRVTYSSASAQLFNSETPVNTSSTIYSISNTTATDTFFAWESQTATANACVVLESYMTAPVLVAIGDSIMSGNSGTASLIETNGTYVAGIDIPDRIATGTRWSVQNMGYSGNRLVGNILPRWTNDVLNSYPRIALLEGGVNDLRDGASTASILAAYNTMLSNCVTAGIQPVLIGIMPFRTLSGATDLMLTNRDVLNLQLRSAVTSAGGVYVDPDPYIGAFYSGGPVNNRWQLTRTADSGDGIHLSNLGRAAVVKAVFEAIAPLNVRGGITAGSVDAGAITVHGPIQFDTGTQQILTSARPTNAAIAADFLWVEAQSAAQGATNAAGGTLLLRSGRSTGSGTAEVVIQTPTPGSSGTADAGMATRATFSYAGANIDTANNSFGAFVNPDSRFGIYYRDSLSGATDIVGVYSLPHVAFNASSAISSITAGLIANTAVTRAMGLYVSEPRVSGGSIAAYFPVLVDLSATPSNGSGLYIGTAIPTGFTGTYAIYSAVTNAVSLAGPLVGSSYIDIDGNNHSFGASATTDDRFGIYYRGALSSTVNTVGIYSLPEVSTNSAFTASFAAGVRATGNLSATIGYYAPQPTEVSASVTNHFGLWAQTSTNVANYNVGVLIGAGLPTLTKSYSLLSSDTNEAAFTGPVRTDTAFVSAGNAHALGNGAYVDSRFGLYVRPTIASSVNAFGVYSLPQVSGNPAAPAAGVAAGVIATQPTATAIGLQSVAPTESGSGVITNWFGVAINTSSVADNTTGLYIGTTSPGSVGGNYAIYSASTAASVFNGAATVNGVLTAGSTLELGHASDTTLARSAAGVVTIEGNTILTSATIRSGTGTPEGAVTAPVGTLFLRTDGGAGTTLYVKESGTGNTGWAAK